MADKKLQYATKLPTVVFEMFQQRVMDYHFTGLGDVMNYLLDSYCRLHSGKKVSKTMKKVLSHMDIEWMRFFRYSEKSFFIFEVSREFAMEVRKLADKQGYATRNQLTNQLIGAFVASAHVTLRQLSKELNELKAVSGINGTMIATYVSNYQFMFLRQMAVGQRTSLMSLLGSASDMFLQLEDDNPERYVSETLRKIAKKTLDIQGVTTKEFRRGKKVAITIDEERSLKILCFMQKYHLRSPREFLRRVILFFFDAQYLIYKDGLSCGEDMPEDENEEYEEYLNGRYAKKEFARSLYGV